MVRCLEQAVGTVSTKLRRGKHTTRSVRLLETRSGDGMLADTPGFNQPSLEGLSLEQLPESFPEVRARLESARCAFCVFGWSDCTHCSHTIVLRLHVDACMGSIAAAVRHLTLGNACRGYEVQRLEVDPCASPASCRRNFGYRSCAFSDCQHLHEPGCIVRGDWQRYPFYVEMHAEVCCLDHVLTSANHLYYIRTLLFLSSLVVPSVCRAL